MNYFDDPTHIKLLTNYVAGQFGGSYLVFTDEWKQKNLPTAGTNELRIVLRDMTDSKEYELFTMYCAYETSSVTVLNDDYQSVEVCSLMSYFYGGHHCPCHRKADAKSAGVVVEDDSCEGNRFLIERITPVGSELILHSEIYDAETLGEFLLGFIDENP